MAVKKKDVANMLRDGIYSLLEVGEKSSKNWKRRGFHFGHVKSAKREQTFFFHVKGERFLVTVSKPTKNND